MPFHRPERREPTPLRLIGDALDLIVIMLGSIMIVLMFLNVLSRTVLQVDVAANVELGEFMLVWATFLGGAAAARRSAHMRITEFVEAMPRWLSRKVEVMTRLIVLVILGLLVWNGAIIAHHNMDQQTTVLYWPVGLTYAALPVGSFFMIIFVAWEAWRIALGEQVFDTSNV